MADEIQEKGKGTGLGLFPTSSISPVSPIWMRVDAQPNQAQSAPKQQEGEIKFGDSSWPLFSIYSKNAEEEDIKMAERWQKDADGIILFVSLYVRSRTPTDPTDWIWKTIDRSILCLRRSIGYSVGPGSQTRLSREHLSSARRPQCNSFIHCC
jgi:hypothetical protein